jgi:transcription-repair coupling factor (superfamily II helicase)
VVIGFRGNVFANPAGLLAWISSEGDNARVRPDQKVVVMRDWETPEGRLKGTAAVLAEFARLADGGKREAA